MGDKLVNECCQTKACDGKPVECNLKGENIAERRCKFSEQDVQDFELCCLAVLQFIYKINVMFIYLFTYFRKKKLTVTIPEIMGVTFH